MAGAATSAVTQRAIAIAVLLVAGLLSLPLAAGLLDGESTENYIVPAQIAVMAVLGAVVGYLLPGVAGAGSSSTRGAGIGAVLGVAAALVAVVVFFLLVSGFSGA
ncbi:MAG: hypothetical protein AVDCRST_MAG34-84 [uncultured Nocardioidaceae bacterium]|uniref:Uncharacterized protein n=1 Tax=uncultured Nocardioidaceae bacterium TaxID=253824 RepID=A0A6J4LBI3_9ACTN|nr:MAG: hypothetical protein AVDCRST_MAG34-84 [uncultured Nocardioidaceae bacterium]